MIGLSDIRDIAKACGKPKKYSRGWMFCCPCHDDRNPSCAAWISNGRIYCKCFSGCDWKDICDALRAKGFVLSVSEQKGYSRRDLSSIAHAHRPVHDHDCAVRSMLARDLWAEAHSAIGSPVAEYLSNRGLDLSVVPQPDRTIRYHPHCPRGKSRQPAMVCCARDLATDQVISVHRTFLRDGRKDGTPMMLGPSFETAIKLSPHGLLFANGRTFIPLLHIAEGVESGIGCLMLGCAPVWAVGSAGAMSSFPPQLQIGELIVMADFDRQQLDVHGNLWRPGVKAAEACVRNWRMMGWRAHYELPDREGDDFADVARIRGGIMQRS